MVINSPGNPVGNIVRPDEMREIYEIIDGQAYVLNDEIYNNTMFYENFHSPLALLPERADMTIVTNSFSKGYRMIHEAHRLRDSAGRAPGQPARDPATHPALHRSRIPVRNDRRPRRTEDSPEELNRVYRSRAEYTTERLRGTGCHPVAAEGGFYAMLRCEEWNRAHGFASSKELARDILRQVHVAVVPGTDFGVPQDLRLAFCNERYNEAIDRLREYFTTSITDRRSSQHRALGGGSRERRSLAMVINTRRRHRGSPSDNSTPLAS